VQRKQPGVPKGRPEKVADGGVEMDTDYIYFVDRDGDISRAKRAVGGQKRKKKAASSRASRKPAKKAAKKSAKKSVKNAAKKAKPAKKAAKAKKSAPKKKAGGKKKGRR
jgi:hypothetical protein